MLRTYLILVSLIPNIIGEPKLASKSITVRSGSAISQYVIPGDGERISACMLEFKNAVNETERIGLLIEGIQTFDNDPFRKRLSNIGRKMCGFKLHTFTTQDSNNYTIKADYISTNNTANSISLPFEASTYYNTDKPPLSNSTKIVTISETAIISCSDPHEKTYGCRLFNPKGELVMQEDSLKCDYRIQYVTMDDIGTWKCEMLLSYSTKSIEMYITMELTVPMLQSEKGIWKCILGKTGGFINTDPANTEITLKDHVQYGVVGSNITIKCYVPFSAVSCIVVSPSGDIYYGGSTELFQRGECAAIVTLNASDVGTWTCRFSRDDASLDTVVKVKVLSGEVITGYDEIEVASGDSAELMCKLNAPMQFCYYIDPLGNSYNVSPKKKSDIIEYTGAGLERGDCSVKIRGVKKDQQGIWKCVSANEKIAKVIEWKTRMTVNETITANATALGVSIGIMTVAVVLLGLGLIKRFAKKKKLRNSDASSSVVPIGIGANALYSEERDDLY